MLLRHRGTDASHGLGLLCARVSGIVAAILISSAEPVAADEKESCLAHFVPAVDIGHHSSEPGTRDVFGRAELAYNAELAHHLVLSFSELGFRRVVLINRTMNERGLRSRPRQALCAGADVFISIHHDNVVESKKTYEVIDGRKIGFNDEIGGYTIYFSSKNTMSDVSEALARFISEEFMTIGIPSATEHQAYIADKGRRIVDQKLNIWDYETLVVSKYSSMPAILIEVGFLSNRQDVARLKDATFQKTVAHAIAQATLAACISDPRMIDIRGRIKHERVRQCRGLQL
jgi:N-acetylmuramoyl-L-alanine amidase